MQLMLQAATVDFMQRIEVDPCEDAGDGYTVRLLVAFPLVGNVLPMAVPAVSEIF